MSSSKPIIILFLSIYLTSADYNPVDAVEYAYASALSHCDPASIQDWTCGAACKNMTGYQYYYAEVYNVTSDQSLAFALIMNPTTKKFITTFRGTIGTMELLMEILQGNSVPYNLSNIPGAVVDDYFYMHYTQDLRETLISNLTAAYKSYPDYEFVFTGHSLGGAFATLTILDVINLGIIPRDKTILYSYGCPRVGNQAFAQAVEAAVPEIYRVVHWRDTVPHLPPCKRSDGKCVPSMSESDEESPNAILWPAWHVAQQIFYDQPSQNYTMCVGGEDPKCSDQFELVQTDPTDHLVYMNVDIGCDAASVFKFNPGKNDIKRLAEEGVIQGNEVLSGIDFDIIQV